LGTLSVPSSIIITTVTIKTIYTFIYTSISETAIVTTKSYSTCASKQTTVDWPEVLGRKGDQLPTHRLAKQYIDEGKPITAAEVNKVLAFADIKITQSKLKEILKGQRLEFLNLNSDTTRSDYFLQNIGTVRGKIQVPGVYI
jgi:hypothetical protein